MKKDARPNYIVIAAWAIKSSVTMIGIKTKANSKIQAERNAAVECQKLGLGRFQLTYQTFEI